MQIDILLDKGAYLPTKAHKTDGGFDFYSPIEFTLPPRGSARVDTGVHMMLPEWTCGLIVSKSGLNTRSDIESTGLVDSGYTGSIVVKLQNHSDREYHFKIGEKITQLIILPVPEVELNVIDTLPETERGANGFGSSGRF